ncbi:TAXI family TRAP transporter solute-binding subunit [Aminirod propionatiphilus]|uniref:TAXI family TRAP transporter solute-binding subunit n=1 Tax=Aminirod propionatiphilus TaxID=3415223 RepID=A0ACD1DW85_9BACT|nr:TAXI family TRAP transporter solute-binding subunit [Synergistota bacterium]
MKKMRRIVGLALVFGCVAAGSASAEKLNLMWGSTSASSGLYPMNVAMADVVNRVLDDVHVTVVETGGTGDNFKGMERGELQFGQASDCNIHMAQTGTGIYENRLMKEPRMLFVAHPLAYVVAVTEESGIKDLSGLDGKPFSPGLKGSVSEILYYRALPAFGVRPQFVPSSTGDAVEAMKDRRIVGFSKATATTVPDSAIQDVATARPVRILGFNEEEKKIFKELFPAYGFFTVPASVYAQEGDVSVVGERFGVSVAASLPEEVVYRIFKALYENREQIAATYAGIRGHDVLDLTANSVCWLHPGVIRYFREIGIEPRPEQIPPEYKAN